MFERNSLIVKLELSEFMKVHSVFYVTLLSYVITDLLSDQCQKPHELICHDVRSDKP